MAKGKWNMRLVKGVWIAYGILFIVYLFFSRSPDFISGKLTDGVVVGINEHTYGYGSRRETRRCPVINFQVDSTERSFSDATALYLWPYSIGDHVTMIYNPEKPSEACLFSLVGYWLNLTEVFTAGIILALITLFITVIPYEYDDGFTAALKK
jgi:hypothetical protein